MCTTQALGQKQMPQQTPRIAASTRQARPLMHKRRQWPSGRRKSRVDYRSIKKGKGRMGGTDSSSSSSTVPVAVGAKNAVRTVAQHHQAVVGFLLGFFLVLLLYTTLSSQFGSQTAIGQYFRSCCRGYTHIHPPSLLVCFGYWGFLSITMEILICWVLFVCVC